MRLTEALDDTRTHPLRMPKGWEPPVPAWSSSFEENAETVAMAVVGFQHASTVSMTEHLAELETALPQADIRDFAICDAGGGQSETLCIAYWQNPAKARIDLESVAFTGFWAAHSAPGRGYGIFKELTNIPAERRETLFSGPEHDHGMSQIRSGIVGPIDEHQYWGGMRDRMPISATDALEPQGSVEVVEQEENHVVVRSHQNMAIIRSGQDWSDCTGTQLAEYTGEIQPVLEAGMAFLRDKGAEVNCLSARYLMDIAPDGSPTKRSCGLGYFRSLADLEGWAEHHPTHLAIFETFLGIAPKYGPDLQLKLWHEVSVIPAQGQQAEYVNCRPDTGLLGGLTLR